MNIKRPMKAPSEPITDEELKSIKYPIVGSPKLDGFRCIVDQTPLTSSMKPFTNRHVAEVLSNPIYDGLDGEIVVGLPYKANDNDDVFHRTSGPVRRFDGTPDFTFYVFDYWREGMTSYQKRWIESQPFQAGKIVVLEQRILKSSDEVIAFEQEMVNLGYEGAMIRSLDGRYKEGRCTLKEMNIFKRKPYAECEAEIIDIEEQMANMNEVTIDAMGLTKRSSHQANMIPKGTTGMFVLQSPAFSLSFKAAPGRGFDAKKRQEIWDNRHEYIGKIATVKYQRYGSIDRPRQPNVIKIRPTWDL